LKKVLSDPSTINHRHSLFDIHFSNKPRSLVKLH